MSFGTAAIEYAENTGAVQTKFQEKCRMLRKLESTLFCKTSNPLSSNFRNATTTHANIAKLSDYGKLLPQNCPQDSKVHRLSNTHHKQKEKKDEANLLSQG